MPFVEREDLVARLHAASAAATAGHGAVVVVRGEAGAGKTSVVRAAFPDATRGFCDALSTPRPLGPFVDIAAQLWPGTVPRGGTALGDRLLRHLREPAPPLVVEDAHWLDTASGDVLRFLARRLGDTPGLVVVTTRDEAAPTGVLQRSLGDLSDVVGGIEVPPLSDAEVGRLIAGSGLDVERVRRLTDGNAFLVGQLVADPGGLPGRPVTDAVAARLARLRPAARDLVELLAVVPGRIPAGLVGPDWPLVDELVAAALMRVDGPAAEFRHELVRLAVVESVPPGRRPALHGEILDRFAHLHGVEPARVAHHARLAHRMDVARAADTEAGTRAAAVGSHHEAVAHYRRAVDDARGHAPAADRVRGLLLLAAEEAAIAHDAEARAAAREAGEVSATSDDPLLRSAAIRTMGRLEPSEQTAHELTRTAITLAASRGPSAELAAAYADLATGRMLARDLAEAVRFAEQAMAMARRFGDVRTEVVASNALGSALLLTGDEAGRTPLRRAVHLAAAHGWDSEVGRAYGNLVSAAGEARLYALSATAAREASRYLVARDLDGMAAYTRAWTARCQFEQGRWAQAAEQLAVLAADADRSNAITRLMTHYLTARWRARTGTGSPAADLHEADRIAAVTGSLQRMAPVAAARAEAAWLAGEPIDVEPLEHVLALAVARASPWATGEIGFWLWRAGAPVALPDTAATPFRLHVAGDPTAAAAAWSALGCPYEAADALSDATDAADVTRALRAFTDLGAGPARQRAARRLRDLGVRSVPRGPQPSTTARVDGLTARESEVHRWLADGHTDGEIAARLQLSVRTVEHHVAAILRKTGAPNRRELRRRATPAGADGTGDRTAGRTTGSPAP